MQIYIIATIIDRCKATLHYRVTDIDSGEVKEVTKEDLIYAIKNNKWAFKNSSVKEYAVYPRYSKGYRLEIKEGIDEIPEIDTEGRITSSKIYILVSVDLVKNTGRLIKTDGTIGDADLGELIDGWRLIAGIKSEFNREYRKIIETEPTKNEIKLLNKTNKLYEEFTAKTRLIGVNCSFEYSVSGDAVILTYYTGSSTHAIVPKFIDVIDTRAFYNKGITTVSLNDGLQVIGHNALSFNDIAEVDIPKTVTRICKYAFYNNNKLFKQLIKDGKSIEKLDWDKFRVYNKDIVISQQTLE